MRNTQKATLKKKKNIIGLVVLILVLPSPSNHLAVTGISRSLSAPEIITKLKDVGRKKLQQWKIVHQGADRHWKVASGMKLCETRSTPQV